MNKFSKNIIFILSILLLFSITLLPTLINFIFFPSNINLLVGDTHTLDFNIPAVATVVSSDSSISINNTVLQENDNVDLNQTLHLQSNEEGSVNMQISMLGIPIKNVTVSVLPDIKLIPCGNTIGVRINTQGVMVLGIGTVTGKDKNQYSPAKDILYPGDVILKVNSVDIDSKETLIDCIQNSNNLELEIKRDNNIINISLNSVIGEDGKNKIGVWVRDSTQGIGTLTYINPEDNSFGALGHGIVDVDTQEIMEVKDGVLMQSEIIDVKKGEKGSPGELIGNINKDNIIGNINKNTSLGIYGSITDLSYINGDNAIPIGLKDKVEIGEAYILSNINGNSVEKYTIEIESINKYNIDDSKSMVIKITDERLLSKTNGIVQGMSGSPIIQNDKIIGAVTHVFVNNPSKGYGIFIENMLNQNQ